MEQKHTPGPWGIDANPSMNLCYVGPGNYRGLASLSFTFRDKERVMADARLIAAAPDLLEACQLALDWLESTGADGSPLAKVRDALAKVDG